MFSRFRVAELGDPICSIVLLYSSSSFLREIRFFCDAVKWELLLSTRPPPPPVVVEFIDSEDGA